MKMKLIAFSLLLCYSEAFLEDLKSSLGSAKTYLDGVLPMLADGLKAVKKFEEFVDNTIEEDCYYECPKGYELRGQKEDHEETSNGCGSLDIIFDDSENSLIHVEAEFSDCCNSHDECYDSCGEDKDLCDLSFRKCLYRVCRKDEHQRFLDNKKCKLKAKLFYMAVVGVGCVPFKDAQKNACNCVKRVKRTEL